MGMLSDEGKGLAKRFAMEKLRSAQGEYESHLDKLIAPTEEEGLEGALSKIGLQAKSFFGDSDATNALKKVAAKKALEKSTQSIKPGAEDAVKDIATTKGTQMVTKALGGDDSTLGGGFSGGMSAFMKSGGNPYAAAAGAVMGIMSASAKRKEKRRQAEADAMLAQAKGEASKRAAKQSMSKSISTALLAASPAFKL